LFVLTAVVAVAACAATVNWKPFGVSPIEAAIMGGLAALLTASRWQKIWCDRRNYDDWPRTGVFPPETENEDAQN
jgi:hypothetical protein